MCSQKMHKLLLMLVGSDGSSTGSREPLGVALAKISQKLLVSAGGEQHRQQGGLRRACSRFKTLAKADAGSAMVP
jgi:hypothetical protein